MSEPLPTPDPVALRIPPVAGDPASLSPATRAAIASAARMHLAALEGLSEVDGLEAIVRRTLAPTAALLGAELRRAGL